MGEVSARSATHNENTTPDQMPAVFTSTYRVSDSTAAHEDGRTQEGALPRIEVDERAKQPEFQRSRIRGQFADRAGQHTDERGMEGQ